MTLFIMINRNMMLLLCAILLYGCVYRKSGGANFNRDIAVTALSGNVYIRISGRISEDVYAYDPNGYKERLKEGVYETMPIVAQGTETINETIILHEAQTFAYTLTVAEVVIMTIRSIDGNDAQLIVYEYGKNKKYTINGKNKLGQVISLKN
ncbi:MAG: hypothetical protein LBG43_06845 [Treponema sp.]|nr:hypothetical protein [Treponema sp.]